MDGWKMFQFCFCVGTRAPTLLRRRVLEKIERMMSCYCDLLNIISD